MAYKIPACLICFYPDSDGYLPTSLHCETLEEAYTIVCIRDQDIECVMLLGDVIDRKMAFRNFEHYQQRKTSYSHPFARAIFHRIAGAYNPNMRRRWEDEQQEYEQENN